MNARLAGFMILLYIAIGITALILFSLVDSAQGTAAKLATIAEHAPRVRFSIALLQLMIMAPWCWPERCTRSRATKIANSRGSPLLFASLRVWSAPCVSSALWGYCGTVRPPRRLPRILWQRTRSAHCC
jgi:hypothetical protein